MVDVRVIQFLLDPHPVSSAQAGANPLLSHESRELLANFHIAITVDCIKPVTRPLHLTARPCLDLEAACHLM